MSKKTKKGLPSYKLSSLNIVKLSNDTDHKPYTMFPSREWLIQKFGNFQIERDFTTGLTTHLKNMTMVEPNQTEDNPVFK